MALWQSWLFSNVSFQMQPIYKRLDGLPLTRWHDDKVDICNCPVRAPFISTSSTFTTTAVLLKSLPPHPDFNSVHPFVRSCRCIYLYHFARSININRTRICKLFGKEGTYTNIMNHIEVNHIIGFAHACDICMYDLPRQLKANLSL